MYRKTSKMGGHGPPYEIPDYTKFRIDDIPQLKELEKALQAKGLRDPWIRNEAWRYHPGFGSKWARANKALFRGLPLGLALALVTVGATKMFGKEDEHGHGAH
ncbi:hypothetical protein PYW08_008971 [Mythimna loreyi]|uniref:Uncharacterized protein n=1 Tax=Mythimna loreyi TaxID=667449 RepID=A0ACC2Q846_9NEOP|nr:hypothetical protein PYW08_008971 [Mythimna loreyi]